MTPITAYGPVIGGLIVMVSGLSVIAVVELFLAIRENTLNSRAALGEALRGSRYDYGALHVVGWVNIGLGAFMELGGVLLLFSPLFK